MKSIDLSKLKSKDEPLVERSVIEPKPRELNLPKSTQDGAQTQTKSQEVSKPLPKTDTPKSESVATSTVYKPKEKNVNSEMPSTDLLDRVLDDGSSLTKEQLDEVADRLEIKLQEFGVEAKVVSVIPGPVVTRFEIQPAPGTKASKITNIAQDCECLKNQINIKGTTTEKLGALGRLEGIAAHAVSVSYTHLTLPTKA